MIKLIGILLIMLLIMPCITFAEIYKWINDDGSIGFTDDLSKVPEKYRDQVEIKKYRTNSSQKENGERIAKSNQSTKKEDLVEKDYREQEELLPEEKGELDKKLRGIWDDMKNSLKGR